MLMKGDIMRFKKIVFGLILSLLLAFPAYASEITPISVGDTRSQSDIILRASGGYDVTTTITLRSEERRVGKECRSRWSPYH